MDASKSELQETLLYPLPAAAACSCKHLTTIGLCLLKGTFWERKQGLNEKLCKVRLQGSFWGLSQPACMHRRCKRRAGLVRKQLSSCWDICFFCGRCRSTVVLMEI